MNDNPIIDQFDSDDDHPATSRRKSWGSRVAASLRRNNTKPVHGNDASYSADKRAKRNSWKDLSAIRRYLGSIDESLKSTDEVSNKHPYERIDSSKSQQRRAWYSKLRYQQQLIARLTGIEKTLKRNSSGGGLAGLLGSMGGLGALLAKARGKNGILGGSGGGLTKSILTGLLGTLLAKSAIGAGARGSGRLLKHLLKRGGSATVHGAKSFGRKAISMTGTMLKAGKARLLTGVLPSLGVGGLAEALGGLGVREAGGRALTAALRTVLPSILGRIGMAVFGIPGAVAMTAKLIWDQLLPESWKKYITYKVSKFYLAAIEKVASMFEWIGEKFDEVKKYMSEMYARALVRIYAALDFVSNLITGEGDARQKVKDYFSTVWTSLETTLQGYIAGFLTVFKNAYNTFIKPFYDANGNFSLMAGIKYYGKAGYDLGVKAINNAGAAVDSAVNSAKAAVQGMLDSNYNPANWRKNAEKYVKEYEANKAKQEAAAKNNPDPTAGIFASTQDAANAMLGQVDKTLKNTNRYLQVATQASMGVASGLTGSFMNGYNGGATSIDYSTTGSSLANTVGAAESNQSYNATNNGRAGYSSGNYNLSSLTIGQVKQLQSHSNPGGRKLFAVGKYQVVPETLKEAQKSLGLSDNMKFTPQVQEHIFQNYLIAEKRKAVKAYITGQSNDLVGAQVALAQEFASIGMPYSGSMRVGNKIYTFRKDGTFYSGKGGNKASVSSAQSAAMLQQARASYDTARRNGASAQDAWNASFNATGSGSALSSDGMMSASGTVAQAPINAATDPVGAIIQSVGNFNGAGYSNVSVEQPSPMGSINNDDIVAMVDKAPQRVNSIGSQINEDVHRPDEIGLSKEKALQAMSQKVNNLRPKVAVSGTSSQDLFSKTNFANIRQHENAYPM